MFPFLVLKCCCGKNIIPSLDTDFFYKKVQDSSDSHPKSHSIIRKETNNSILVHICAFINLFDKIGKHCSLLV